MVDHNRGIISGLAADEVADTQPERPRYVCEEHSYIRNRISEIAYERVRAESMRAVQRAAPAPAANIRPLDPIYQGPPVTQP